MHPLEQFGRVFWAGFEQLAAAGEAADELERKHAGQAQPPQAEPAAAPAAKAPREGKREPQVIDTEGADL